MSNSELLLEIAKLERKIAMVPAGDARIGDWVVALVSMYKSLVVNLTRQEERRAA